MTSTVTTNTNKKPQITQGEAIENVRELGSVFVDALFQRVGKRPKTDSQLMNGLVAYEVLNLKGEWDYIDESVDIVMRIIYKKAIEDIEKDEIK